jgi:hypothetical protein
MKTARKTVMLPVIIAKEMDIWRDIVGNPRNALKDGLSNERQGSSNYSGNESRPSESGSRPTVKSIQ